MAISLSSDNDAPMDNSAVTDAIGSSLLSPPSTLVVPQIKSANSTRAKNLYFFIVAAGYIALLVRSESTDSIVISGPYPSSTDEQIERPKEVHCLGLARLGSRKVFNAQFDGAPATLRR